MFPSLFSLSLSLPLSSSKPIFKIFFFFLIKDFDLGSYSWVIQVGHKVPYKERGRQESQRRCNDRNRGERGECKGATLLTLKVEKEPTSQGMQEAERPGNRSSQQSLQKEHGAANPWTLAQ